jgi:hypothetical protein
MNHLMNLSSKNTFGGPNLYMLDVSSHLNDPTIFQEEFTIVQVKILA